MSRWEPLTRQEIDKIMRDAEANVAKLEAERLETVKKHLEKERQGFDQAVMASKFTEQLEAERRARQEAELLAKQCREALNAKHEHSRGEDAAVWYWQPDGDNNLDTLSCPVVIPAQWLRDLLADGQEAEAQAAQMREVLALLGQQPMWAQDDSNDNWTTCAMCGRQNGEHNEDCSLATALATDAGKRMLAVVEAARRWKEAIDNWHQSPENLLRVEEMADELYELMGGTNQTPWEVHSQ